MQCGYCVVAAVDKIGEPFQANASAADMIVAVSSVAQLIFAVVKVKAFDVVQTNYPVKFIHS